jgi:hypothetical protein
VHEPACVHAMGLFIIAPARGGTASAVAGEEIGV